MALIDAPTSRFQVRRCSPSQDSVNPPIPATLSSPTVNTLLRTPAITHRTHQPSTPPTTHHQLTINRQRPHPDRHKSASGLAPALHQNQSTLSSGDCSPPKSINLSSPLFWARPRQRSHPSRREQPPCDDASTPSARSARPRHMSPTFNVPLRRATIPNAPVRRATITNPPVQTGVIKPLERMQAQQPQEARNRVTWSTLPPEQAPSTNPLVSGLDTNQPQPGPTTSRAPTALAPRASHTSNQTDSIQFDSI